MKIIPSVRVLQGISCALVVLCTTLSWSISRQHAQQQKLASQWTMAANKEFQSLAANDVALTTAVQAEDLPTIRNRMGQRGAIIGTVSNVFSARGNKVTIISFSANQREAATAVVQSDNYALFPALNSLKGRKILVTGSFESYKTSSRNAPQIELLNPDQVRIIG